VVDERELLVFSLGFSAYILLLVVFIARVCLVFAFHPTSLTKTPSTHCSNHHPAPSPQNQNSIIPSKATVRSFLHPHPLLFLHFLGLHTHFPFRHFQFLKFHFLSLAPSSHVPLGCPHFNLKH